MLHAVFLLAFILLAAPLASYILLAALAGVLACVAWNMAEKHEFASLIRASRGDAVVLLATFATVIFRDLSQGIRLGFGLSALLFLHRMAQSVEIENGRPLADEDRADFAEGSPRKPYDARLATDPDVMIVRISGAFFFGAAAAVGAALDRIGDHPRAYVIDMSGVSVVDSTGAATIDGFMRKVGRRGAAVSIAGATPSVRRTLLSHGIRPSRVQFRQDVGDALAEAQKSSDSPTTWATAD